MKALIQTISEAHPYVSERPTSDWPAFNCPQDRLLGLLTDLRDNHGFDFLSDLTAIDQFDNSPRFELVYHLYSTERHDYIRIASACSSEADPRPDCRMIRQASA